MAAPARCCDRNAKSSISSRETSSISATFSAVSPIAMYTSGSPSAGVQVPWSPAERAALRAAASSNLWFWVLGVWSELPPTMKRLTASTPAATNTSPSPARTACAAIRMVWSDDEQ